MFPFYKKYARTMFDISLIIFTIFMIMWLGSKIIAVTIPILFGLAIYFINKPVLEFLIRRKVKRNFATHIVYFLFILLVLGLLVLLGFVIVSQTQQLINIIPKHLDYFNDSFSSYLNYVQEKYNSLSPETINIMKDKLEAFSTKGLAMLSTFLITLFSTFTSISNFVLNFVLGTILAYFLSLEIPSWRTVLQEKTPLTFKKIFEFLRKNVLKAIGGYVKAQLKLISITFLIVFVTLFLLQVENAFSISLFAAILDVLPLLGVSTLLIPWIIYLFATGSTVLAIQLTVLWVVVVGARQILEPKITGDSLGVSAFTMFSFMLISLSIFGIAGLLLSPILIILLKSFYDEGLIKKWIHLPEDEYENVSAKEETK